MDILTDYKELITRFIQAAVILVAAYLLFRVVRRGIEVVVKKAHLPTLALKPILLVLRLAVMIVAVMMVAKVFGYDADSILGGLMAVAGLVAIGFVAVWSVLSNTLCTFVLILFKPFSVGDELTIPAENVVGKVVDVSLIFTTLREADGTLIQIPNNMFFQKVFKAKASAVSIDLEEQLGRSKPAV